MMKRELLLLGLLLIGAATVADARTWNVRKDGSGDYTVIQDAVDHAAAGDTLRIGAGRYTEYRPYSPTKKWTYDVYVAITVSALTIIGEGAGVSIIGPETQDPATTGSIGICATLNVRAIAVSDLSIQGVVVGVYRSEGGTTRLERVLARDCSNLGFMTWGDGGTSVVNCDFVDSEYGIGSYPPARDLDIRDCRFNNCDSGISINGTQNAFVLNCTFTGGRAGVKFAEGTRGVISNCSLSGIQNVIVWATNAAHMTLQGCSLVGAETNLWVTNFATVTGDNNVFSGGSFSTIRISGSPVALTHCHILHGQGPSVLVEAFIYPPVVTLDLTNNYWGTSNPDTLAAWIVDHNDVPAVNAVVNFTPFFSAPLSIEKKSLGSLKNLFR